MLYKGLKFDMRIYVLVTGCDPLRVFLFNDGLVRLATDSYEPVTKNNKKNFYKHLTNYAINKLNPNFVHSIEETENLESHKRSISSFFDEVREHGIDVDAIWIGIKKIVVKTLIAIQPTLKQFSYCQQDDPYNSGCFEILGFDIMLDEDSKPILLEVNHNPSLKTDS